MNPDGFEVSKEGRCDGGQGRLDIDINDLYLFNLFFDHFYFSNQVALISDEIFSSNLIV